MCYCRPYTRYISTGGSYTSIVRSYKSAYFRRRASSPYASCRSLSDIDKDTLGLKAARRLPTSARRSCTSAAAIVKSRANMAITASKIHSRRVSGRTHSNNPHHRFGECISTSCAHTSCAVVSFPAETPYRGKSRTLSVMMALQSSSHATQSLSWRSGCRSDCPRRLRHGRSSRRLACTPSNS